MFRIYSDKEDFYLFVLPNYETKQIEVSTDVNTKFSDMVFEFIANSGDLENIIRQVYLKSFQTQPVEAQQPTTLNLPELAIPGQFNFN